MEREMKLEIEELEERIAPGMPQFVITFLDGTQPGPGVTPDPQVPPVDSPNPPATGGVGPPFSLPGSAPGM